MNLRIVEAVLGLGFSAGLTYDPGRSVAAASSAKDPVETSDLRANGAWPEFQLNKAAFGGDSAIDTPLMVTLMERGRNLSQTTGDSPAGAPEPTTLAALGAGALAIFARKRRKAKVR